MTLNPPLTDTERKWIEEARKAAINHARAIISESSKKITTTQSNEIILSNLDGEPVVKIPCSSKQEQDRIKRELTIWISQIA